jgi:hypothetical protein
MEPGGNDECVLGNSDFILGAVSDPRSFAGYLGNANQS